MDRPRDVVSGRDASLVLSGRDTFPQLRIAFGVLTK
jgi:hypothetical protein